MEPDDRLLAVGLQLIRWLQPPTARSWSSGVQLAADLDGALRHVIDGGVLRLGRRVGVVAAGDGGDAVRMSSTNAKGSG